MNRTKTALIIFSVVKYLLCCLLYTITHQKFSLKYATGAGQKLIFDQVVRLLNRVNWACLEQIVSEFPIDIENCPSLNSLGGYIVTNLEHFENAMTQMPILQKFPQMGADLKDFYPFCNVWKLKEALHVCMVTRKRELQKMREENRFKSRQQYLRACRMWPKKLKLFIGYVQNAPHNFAEFERYHGTTWPEEGITFSYLDPLTHFL